MPLAESRKNDLHVFDDIHRMVIKSLKRVDTRQSIAVIYNDYQSQIEVVNHLFLANTISKSEFKSRSEALIVEQKTIMSRELENIFSHDKTKAKIDYMYVTIKEELTRRGLVNCTREREYFPIPENDLPIFLDFIKKLQKKYPKSSVYKKQITFFVGIDVSLKGQSETTDPISEAKYNNLKISD